jgi:hypothetical protein
VHGCGGRATLPTRQLRSSRRRVPTGFEPVTFGSVDRRAERIPALAVAGGSRRPFVIARRGPAAGRGGGRLAGYGPLLGRWRRQPPARSAAQTSSRRARWPTCSAFRARPCTNLPAAASYQRDGSGAAGSSCATGSPQRSRRSTIGPPGNRPETAPNNPRALLHSATPRPRNQRRKQAHQAENPATAGHS